MKTVKLMLCSIPVLLAASAMAADSGSATNASAPGNHAALEAALKACAAQVGVDTTGRPDRAAFDTCMKAKGFEKPSGPPPGERGGPKGPPPQ